MSMFADTVVTQGSSPFTTSVVAQIASFSISAVQSSMFLLRSDCRLDNTSTSLLVFLGDTLCWNWNLPILLPTDAPLQATWLTYVSKWIVVSVHSVGHGVVQEFMEFLSYCPVEGQELQLSCMHVIVFLCRSCCLRRITHDSQLNIMLLIQEGSEPLLCWFICPGYPMITGQWWPVVYLTSGRWDSLTRTVYMVESYPA